MRKLYICEACNKPMKFIRAGNNGWGMIEYTYKCPLCGNEESEYQDDPNGPQHQPGFKGWR